MAQNLFQRNDMPATYDEVSREGVPQYMTGLPFGRVDRGQVQYFAEHAHAVGERAMLCLGDAVAIHPGFDGFNVLLRAYQLVGVQLFQSHVVPCLFVSILGKLDQSNKA